MHVVHILLVHYMHYELQKMNKLEEKIMEFDNDEWWLDFELNESKKTLEISNCYKGTLKIVYTKIEVEEI